MSFLDFLLVPKKSDDARHGDIGDGLLKNGLCE
jgi:hypothetical protein